MRQFQDDDDVPFFVLSLKAGGAGLNLTAASHVIHFDRWWNPAVENQATDRAFRIGQTKNVLVHKFVCRGTVEEKIDQMIEAKQQLAGDFLSGGADMVLTEMKDDELAEAGGARSGRGDEGGLMDELLRSGRPYVPVAERRRRAERKLAKLRKKGQSVAPVTIEGRTIAKTFWGKSWCNNLERYSDYANRLPRGRTYVRNGSVVDLQIAKGEVAAMVSGSELYKVEDHHRAGRRERAGKPSAGIAPERSIRWSSCCRAASPKASWTGSAGRATACFRRRAKSSCRAAARTGPTCASTSRRCSTASAPGSTQSPELLFVLRGVDENELLASAGQDTAAEQSSAGHSEGA